MTKIIALDVGGGSIKSGVVDLAVHTVVDFQTHALDSYASADAILGALAGAVSAHMAAAQPLAGVALGFPGPFDYDTGISYIRTPGIDYTRQQTKFGAIYGMNVRDALRRRLQQPSLEVRFRNDAEAAILGEAKYGAGKTHHRLIGVTLGTGFGSAFLVNGVPQTSGAGVPDNGWLYPMPVAATNDTADDAFSTRGLLKRLHNADLPFDTVKDAADAARTGEVAAQVMFAGWGADLGAFMRPWLSGFDANGFLMVGGIARAFDLFGEPLQRALDVPAFTGGRGAYAPLLGAADLFV